MSKQTAGTVLATRRLTTMHGQPTAVPDDQVVHLHLLRDHWTAHEVLQLAAGAPEARLSPAAS
jgi:hypothetical protein